MHKDKFFKDNIKKFETNDFDLVRKLVGLLNNEETDNKTKSILCYDLGEFARFHPFGKK